MKGQASEQDLPKLQIDDPVNVTILSTDKKVSGRISVISDIPTSSQNDNTILQFILLWYKYIIWKSRKFN